MASNRSASFPGNKPSLQPQGVFLQRLFLRGVETVVYVHRHPLPLNSQSRGPPTSRHTPITNGENLTVKHKCVSHGMSNSMLKKIEVQLRRLTCPLFFCTLWHHKLLDTQFLSTRLAAVEPSEPNLNLLFAASFVTYLQKPFCTA